ncbi:MAG: hypothetical protein C0597_15540 [Marinilabiliales bacterium]|nr:MAG: hypothetical protein C0597_15540 [Marinilabiliales bacterium]
MKTKTNILSGSNAQFQKVAKVTGLLFILNLILPLFNYSLLLAPLNVENDVIATAKNIMENESLFRIGITIELLLSVGLVMLAVFLYNILSGVNKNLARLALSIKVAEAVLMAVTVLIPLVALQMVNGSEGLSIYNQDQSIYPVGVIFNSHTALTSIPMFFLGIDMILFSYLFLKSRYIPAWISILGIISFALIFIHAVMFIIAPTYAKLPVSQFIFWTPSGVFEIIAGLWLLVKGIKNDR